ncbi:AvrE-family type 3 secretion system effector [Pseudomonas zeae]|uniref:AvrE-family type 3 secretion system effector n=1 Tax=Pseudomonas zeae TaxID=2745510 RepID=UPI0039E04302
MTGTNQAQLLLNKGKPQFNGFQPASVAKFIEHTLTPVGQTYQACHSDKQNHFLLDAKGYLLHVHHSEEATCVVRSTLPQGAPAGDSRTQHIQYRDSSIWVSGAPAQDYLQKLPRAHIGHLTGIYQDRAGQRLCLHEQQLYVFDKRKQTWGMHSGMQGKNCSELVIQGNGRIYGQVKGVLVDLTGRGMPKVILTAAFKSFSVSADQQMALLGGGEGNVLQIINLRQPPPSNTRFLRIELDGGLAKFKSIGLGKDHLFICDTEGRLYSTRRDDLTHSELTVKPRLYMCPADESLGRSRQVLAFLSGNEGEIHALVSDRNGQVHTFALNGESQRMEGGWNLTDALVVKNRCGLPGAVAPAPTDTWDLGRLGQIGLSEQRIMCWDAAGQAWKDTGIKDVVQLQCGRDGKAYVLQGGALKSLDVNRKHQSLPFGGSHALTLRPHTIAVKQGQTIAGVAEGMVKAFAVLNEKQFVVLDNSQRLSVHHKAGEPTMLNPPLKTGKVTALAFDEKHQLYLLQGGKLFVMGKDAWQSSDVPSRSSAFWRAVDAPPGVQVMNIRTADNQHLCATFRDWGNNQTVQLKGQVWEALEAAAAIRDPFAELAGRVRSDEIVGRIPGIGMTLRANFTLAGRSSMESGLRSNTMEYVRAHIFKPTMEVPRVLKNMAHSTQHHYLGRKGLKQLYASESQVFQQLHASNTVRPDDRDLKARIAGLKLAAEGLVVTQALEAFRDQLEQDSHRVLKSLGLQYGQSKLLRQSAGVLDMQGNVSTPSRRRDMSMKASELSQKLNINRSGHDLLKALKASMHHLAPHKLNVTSQLLDALQNQGVHLSHAKAEVPLGQRRDGSDSLGLIKARLALNAVAVSQLVDVVQRLEMLPAEGASEAMLGLQKELEKKRAGYEADPIKQVTDMGFADHSSLEAAYDGIKAFLNGFEKSDHATSVNLRAATGSANQSELAQALKTTLRHLNADDEIALQRSYGLNLSSPTIPIFDVTPSAAVAGARSYGLNAERGDKGITISLQRDGSAAGSVGVGYAEPLAPLANINLGNNHLLTWAFRVGADVSISTTATQRNAVVFVVPDEDIDQFVDGLFSGELNPMQIMQKGKDQAAQKSLRFTVEVNASATAEMRIGANLTQNGSSPASAAARAGVWGALNTNLLSYTSNSVDQRNAVEQSQERSQNRVRLFNSAGASASAKTQFSGNYSATKQNSVGAAMALGVGAAVAVDSKTTKRIKCTFKEAVPVTEENMTEVTAALRSAFKDSLAQHELTCLAATAAEKDPKCDAEAALQEHLLGLKLYFNSDKVQNDEQHAARQALLRLAYQHEAAKKRYVQLDSGRFESAYTNLSRINEQGVVSKIMGLVNAHHAPSNAERVTALLNEDPTLKSLIKLMKSSPGTVAKVRLELKDQVQSEIQRRSLAEKLTPADLEALFRDRNNLRIKAITVSQSASKADGFTSPTPLVSYSSAAALNVTKVLGKISFSYGIDEDTPTRYVLEGELSKPSEAFNAMAADLESGGFEFNR